MNKEYIDLKRRIVYRGEVYQAIEDERIKTLPAMLGNSYMTGVHDGLKKALVALANNVNDIPTADVVEARSGVWTEKIVDDWTTQVNPFMRRRFYCSACGDWNTHGASKYCPNCGAKMDGGVNDGKTD